MMFFCSANFTKLVYQLAPWGLLPRLISIRVLGSFTHCTKARCTLETGYCIIYSERDIRDLMTYATSVDSDQPTKKSTLMAYRI